MVYLASSSFWLGLSQVIVSLSSFLIAIAFAHYVSKEAYGQYKYTLSIVGILGTLTLTGLGTALVQSVTQKFEGTLHYAFWKNIQWNVFFCLGFAGIAVYYFLQGNPSLATSMLIVGSLAPILRSTNFYNSYLSAKKDFRRSALYYGIVGNLFPYASLFVTMMFTDNPIWLVSIYFISNTVIGVILYRRIVSIYKPNNAVDPNFMHYSKHLSLINILSVLANNLDQVLVFHYIGAAELAIYNFAIAIPNQAKALPSNLSNIMFPKFTVRNDKEIRDSMKNKQSWLFLTGLLIVVLYILLAPWIFHIFFPKYMESVFYSRIAILPFLFILFEPAASYLAAKKKIKEQYINSFVTSSFQIISMYIGVVYWGLLGLVVARTLSAIFGYSVIGILYGFSSRKAIQEDTSIRQF